MATHHAESDEIVDIEKGQVVFRTKEMQAARLVIPAGKAFNEHKFSGLNYFNVLMIISNLIMRAGKLTKKILLQHVGFAVQLDIYASHHSHLKNIKAMFIKEQWRANELCLI